MIACCILAVVFFSVRFHVLCLFFFADFVVFLCCIIAWLDWMPVLYCLYGFEWVFPHGVCLLRRWSVMVEGCWEGGEGILFAWYLLARMRQRLRRTLPLQQIFRDNLCMGVLGRRSVKKYNRQNTTVGRVVECGTIIFIAHHPYRVYLQTFTNVLALTTAVAQTQSIYKSDINIIIIDWIVFFKVLVPKIIKETSVFNVFLVHEYTFIMMVMLMSLLRVVHAKPHNIFIVRH